MQSYSKDIAECLASTLNSITMTDQITSAEVITDRLITDTSLREHFREMQQEEWLLVWGGGRLLWLLVNGFLSTTLEFRDR